MGKVDEEENYRCFTFEEAMNQPHLFVMGQAQTEVCVDLADAETRPLYRIFGKSKGTAIRLTTDLICVSHFSSYLDQVIRKESLNC